MATHRVTFALPSEQLDDIKHLVESGHAPSVSGFARHAVSVALDDVVGWGVMLAEALDVSGGKLTAAERRWADQKLGVTRRRRGSTA